MPPGDASKNGFVFVSAIPARNQQRGFPSSRRLTGVATTSAMSCFAVSSPHCDELHAVSLLEVVITHRSLRLRSCFYVAYHLLFVQEQSRVQRRTASLPRRQAH